MIYADRKRLWRQEPKEITLFESVTAITKSRCHIFVRSRVKKTFLTFLIGLTVSLLLLSLFALLGQGYYPFLPFALPFFILAVFIVLCWWLTTCIDGATMYRRNQRENIKSQTVTIYQDHFVVTSGNAVSDHKFSQLLSAKETVDCFYLLLEKDSVFMMEKSGFREGTPSDFRAFLLNKMGAKL